jgi:hypothetical protein
MRRFIYAPEERKEKHVNALAKLCSEHNYPSSWANIPPGSLVPSSGAEIDDHEDQ